MESHQDIDIMERIVLKIGSHTQLVRAHGILTLTLALSRLKYVEVFITVMWAELMTNLPTHLKKSGTISTYWLTRYSPGDLYPLTFDLPQLATHNKTLHFELEKAKKESNDPIRYYADNTAQIEVCTRPLATPLYILCARS